MYICRECGSKMRVVRTDGAVRIRICDKCVRTVQTIERPINEALPQAQASPPVAARPEPVTAVASHTDKPAGPSAPTGPNVVDNSFGSITGDEDGWG